MVLRHRVVNRFEPKERSDDIVVELVRRALDEWGAKKKHQVRFNAKLGPHLSEVGEHAFASFRKVRFEAQTAVRWRLREGTAPHFYRSSITLLIEDDRAKPSWIWYDIETDRESSFFQPPALTSYLVKALDAKPMDSIGHFSEGLRAIRGEQLGEFLDHHLESERRKLPVIVSATRGWRNGEEEHIEDALATLLGVATFSVLTPDGVDEFNDELVSPGYQVYPGSLHMFQPDLDTDDELDSRRHRWWSASEVRAKSSRDLAASLYSEAMKSLLKLPLPESLIGLGERIDSAATESMLRRLSTLTADANADADAEVENEVAESSEPELSVEALTAPTESSQVSADIGVGDNEMLGRRSRRSGSGDPDELALLHDLDEVASILSLPAPPESVGLFGRLRQVLGAALTRLRHTQSAAVSTELISDLRGQLEDLQEERSQLETDRDDYRALLEASETETKEAREELESQKIKAQEIRRQQQEATAKAEHFELLYQDTLRHWNSDETPRVWDAAPALDREQSEAAEPGSVEELLEWIDGLEYVERCAELDGRSAISVRDSRQRDRILRDAWRYALELEEYAKSPVSRGRGGLAAYIRDYSATITNDQFARDESNDVKTARKGRLAKMRTFSVPEEVDSSGSAFFGAHFRLTQDNGKAMRMHIYDATDKNGKVYLGYIGPHHRSRKTN